MDSSTIGKELCMSIASLPPVCGLENVLELQILVHEKGMAIESLVYWSIKRNLLNTQTKTRPSDHLQQIAVRAGTDTAL